MTNKRIVIIGATSAIAEQCARLWVEQSSVNLTLVARNLYKAEIISSDLKARSPKSIIEVSQTDFLDAESIKSFVDTIARDRAVDIALIAHGSLPDQKNCEEDLKLNQNALQLNAISPVLFAEAFAVHMQKANKGKLGLIGSVAGDRGRKSNYVYGAAKGLVTRYTEGLQHRLADTGVKVVLIKPGPTNTPMTTHLKKSSIKLADAADVAKQIVSGIESGKRVIYAPKKWLFIMLIIRHLPHFVFKRFNI